MNRKLVLENVVMDVAKSYEDYKYLKEIFSFDWTKNKNEIESLAITYTCNLLKDKDFTKVYRKSLDSFIDKVQEMSKRLYDCTLKSESDVIKINDREFYLTERMSICVDDYIPRESYEICDIWDLKGTEYVFVDYFYFSGEIDEIIAQAKECINNYLEKEKNRT